jgi:hypothetical protein
METNTKKPSARTAKTAKTTRAKTMNQNYTVKFVPIEDFISGYPYNPYNPRNAEDYKIQFKINEEQELEKVIEGENELINDLINSLVVVDQSNKTVSFNLLRPFTANPDGTIVDGNSRKLVLESLMGRQNFLNDAGYKLVLGDQPVMILQNAVDLMSAFVGFNTSVPIEGFQKFCGQVEAVKSLVGQEASYKEIINLGVATARVSAAIGQWLAAGDNKDKEIIANTEANYLEYIPALCSKFITQNDLKEEMQGLFLKLIEYGVSSRSAARIIGLPGRESGTMTEEVEKYFAKCHQGLILSEADAQALWGSLHSVGEEKAMQLDPTATPLPEGIELTDRELSAKKEDAAHQQTIDSSASEELIELQLNALRGVAHNMDALAQFDPTKEGATFDPSGLEAIAKLEEIILKESRWQEEAAGIFLAARTLIDAIVADLESNPRLVAQSSLKSLVRLGKVRKGPKEKKDKHPNIETEALMF